MSESAALIFVYGSLQPGERAWSIVSPNVRRAVEDDVDGVLWDTQSGFPAAVFSSSAVEDAQSADLYGAGSEADSEANPEGSAPPVIELAAEAEPSDRKSRVRVVIPGWVLLVLSHNLEELLADLDQFEGVDEGLFQRVTVRTGRGHEAWAWQWSGDVRSMRPLHHQWSEHPHDPESVFATRSTQVAG